MPKETPVGSTFPHLTDTTGSKEAPAFREASSVNPCLGYSAEVVYTHGWTREVLESPKAMAALGTPNASLSDMLKLLGAPATYPLGHITPRLQPRETTPGSLKSLGYNGSLPLPVTRKSVELTAYCGLAGGPRHAKKNELVSPGLSNVCSNTRTLPFRDKPVGFALHNSSLNSGLNRSLAQPYQLLLANLAPPL